MTSNGNGNRYNALEPAVIVGPRCAGTDAAVSDLHAEERYTGHKWKQEVRSPVAAISRIKRLNGKSTAIYTDAKKDIC